MKAVESSNISHIGYDPATKELRVLFKGGSSYTYQNVSPEAHEALLEADSIGSHFIKHIRPHHQFKKGHK